MLKAVGLDLLPSGLSYAERFRMARRAGFTAVEMLAVADAATAEEVKAAAREAGIGIPSVIAYASTSPGSLAGSPDEIDEAVTMVAAAIANAALWSAQTVLVTPALVDAARSYEAAYRTSQRTIRDRVLPLAAQHGIVLGVENIWYGFLLTPTEYVRYVDEFESPWVRAYLDVGNMVFGHPHHWVRAAAQRIVQVHIKDFWMDRGGGRGGFARLGAGAVDWPVLRRALREVGYAGCVVNTGVPLGFIRRLADRLHGTRYLGACPGLAAVRKSLYPPLLRDLSARFDWFDRLT